MVKEVHAANRKKVANEAPADQKLTPKKPAKKPAEKKPATKPPAVQETGQPSGDKLQRTADPAAKKLILMPLVSDVPSTKDQAEVRDMTGKQLQDLVNAAALMKVQPAMTTADQPFEQLP